MKAKAAGIALFVLLVLNGCGSAREPISNAEWDRLERIVTERNFNIEAQWAEPLPDNSLNNLANAGLLPPGSTASRINLIGNANYLNMRGDSVKTQLPYWGERQTVQAYGRTEGISFSGLAEDIRSSKNEKQQYYDLDFNLRNKSEILQCTLRFYAGKRVLITVQSNQRNQIRYDAIFTEVSDE